VTEQAPLRVAALVQEEVQEWVGPEREQWATPEQVQDPVENASALNAVLQFPMKPEFPASTRSAQNAGQKW
jgi:hypothetical protein